ncbi:thiamine phosphate synthase [Chryseobacterium sp.]|uniref:thiamine phosphate synthase n=1 Tax=Chryseobacterium sp. TaxID=1871047 RepID=UPI0025C043FC|nr:thiamine phosphate synthase [Chryseobacterium sp.]
MERLQYISQGNTALEQQINIQKALDAGAGWIQVRWKNATEDSLRKLCCEVKILCKEYQASYIVNDRVDIAKETEADGVHLGLNDGPVKNARVILGAHKIIGGTANTFSDVLHRIEEECDYIGLGPFRYTPTKEKLSPVLGLDGFQQIFQKLNEQLSVLPKIYAIGGIVSEDIKILKELGLYGVAISGEITNNPDKTYKIKELLQ